MQRYLLCIAGKILHDKTNSLWLGQENFIDHSCLNAYSNLKYSISIVLYLLKSARSHDQKKFALQKKFLCETFAYLLAFMYATFVYISICIQLLDFSSRDSLDGASFFFKLFDTFFNGGTKQNILS